jgi:proton-dependent oligopeptide transporter, POT family
MAVLSGVAGVLFYLSFRHLDAAEEQLNNLQEGHVDEKH